MNKSLVDILAEEKIFPIIRNKNAEEVLNIARALADGGIKILEINVETPEIFKSISEASKFVKVCAGGIITSHQAQTALNSGAEILSSPIFQMNLVKITKGRQVPFIASASTPNEAYNVWKARVPLIKLYPAAAMGGALYVEDMLRPMPFLKVLPQGNIKLTEAAAYIKAGAVAVGVGRDFYDGYTYSEITNRAKSILTELKG